MRTGFRGGCPRGRPLGRLPHRRGAGAPPRPVSWATPPPTDVITFGGDPALGHAGRDLRLGRRRGPAVRAGRGGTFPGRSPSTSSTAGSTSPATTTRGPRAKRAMRRAEARAMRLLERARVPFPGSSWRRRPRGRYDQSSDHGRRRLPQSRATYPIRNAFFSGVILVAPLCLTVWVFSKIIDFVGGDVQAGSSSCFVPGRPARPAGPRRRLVHPRDPDRHGPRDPPRLRVALRLRQVLLQHRATASSRRSPASTPSTTRSGRS